MLGVLGKSTSADNKITRESLTRGGSQEDPQQLLRDLQDSVERESDLKDQLKFAEEEVSNWILNKAFLTFSALFSLQKPHKIKKLKNPCRNPIVNKGIQTQEINEILKFPRSTQTDNKERMQTNDEVPNKNAENNINLSGIRRQSCDECTQTLEIDDCNKPFLGMLKESCEESTQTLENENPLEKREDVINMNDIFKRCHDRERSPFAAILPAGSTRSPSSSLLFPSLISHALRSGAGAGTKFLVSY